MDVASPFGLGVAAVTTVRMSPYTDW